MAHEIQDCVIKKKTPSVLYDILGQYAQDMPKVKCGQWPRPRGGWCIERTRQYELIQNELFWRPLRGKPLTSAVPAVAIPRASARKQPAETFLDLRAANVCSSTTAAEPWEFRYIYFARTQNTMAITSFPLIQSVSCGSHAGMLYGSFRLFFFFFLFRTKRPDRVSGRTVFWLRDDLE